MDADWRWSTVCPWEEGPRWPSTPPWCVLHRDGTPYGVALQAARKRKERTCPELLGPRRRAQLVVVALEVGGRVRGDQKVCECTGHRLSSPRIASDEETCRSSVAHAVGWHVGWHSDLLCSIYSIATAEMETHLTSGGHRYAGLASGELV